MANSYGGLAADLMNLNRLDSGRRYFLAAEALYDKGVQSPVAQYYLYLTKGDMYVTLGKYDSAVQYFDKARPILARFQDPAQEALFAAATVEGYARFRNVDAEVELIEQSIPGSLAAGDLQTARDAYFVLFSVSLDRPAGTRPLDYYQRYDSLRTVLSDRANREYVAEMETKYETEKKALQILLQQKELKRKSQLNTILALSLIAAALLAVGIITRMRLRRTRREAGLQQQFTRRLLLQTEEERSRIAAELHDSISHELLALKSGLRQPGPEPGPRIDGIINDIRRISRNLHPVMLDKIGLEASIRHLCDQLTESGSIFVTAEIDCPRRLSPDLELQLFRIVQESLSNTAKYAGAHAAKVNLAEHNGIVNLTVLDNGQGFNVSEKLASKDSFGLHTLLERGKAIGGKTTITSAGQGTAIHLQAPASYAKPHTIIIADDHPFTLMGTKAFVEGLGYAVLDVCGNGISACNSILARVPDLAVLDMSMPGMNGIEILEALHKKKLPTRVVLLTMHNELSIFNRARELGVAGYVLKELATEELEGCLAVVSRGGACFSPALTRHLQHDSAGDEHPTIGRLSASERKILEMIARQHTSKTIAQMLFISEKTVENHRSAIMKKLDIPAEKNALLIWALKNLPAG